jgi:hypothetical protein
LDSYLQIGGNFMTTNMKPELFDNLKRTEKVIEVNYDKCVEQYASSKLEKNREDLCSLFLNTVLSPKLKTVSDEIWDNKGLRTGQHDFIIIRDDASSLEFGSTNTLLAEGVFSYSGFA